MSLQIRPTPALPPNWGSPRRRLPSPDQPPKTLDDGLPMAVRRRFYPHELNWSYAVCRVIRNPRGLQIESRQLAAFATLAEAEAARRRAIRLSAGRAGDEIYIRTPEWPEAVPEVEVPPTVLRSVPVRGGGRWRITYRSPAPVRSGEPSVRAEPPVWFYEFYPRGRYRPTHVFRWATEVDPETQFKQLLEEPV